MKCKYCGSEKVVKNGRVNGEQFCVCRDCNHRFMDNGKFPKMRTEDQIISAALDLYFDGLSLRKVKRQIGRIFRVKVSHVTIWKWIMKYSELVNEFVNTLEPELSGVWQADETMVNCRSEDGDRFRWFWQIIDEETRWIVTTHLSGDRTTEEAIRLFRKSRRLAGKPKRVVTDGLWAYGEAYKKVFWTRYKAERPEYIRKVESKQD